MTLNLTPVLSGQRDSTLPFQYTPDCSAVSLWGEHPFPEPLEAEGTVRRDSGVLTLQYRLRFVRAATCARCLAPVRLQGERVFSHTLAEETSLEQGESDSGLLFFSGCDLDLDKVVLDDLLPILDGVVLCDEDCKGLCPQCGADRNKGGCGCPQKEPDPRFDAIRKLLEQ